MPKKRQIEQKLKREEPQTLQVRETEEVTTPCRKALGNVIDDKHLGFNGRKLADNKLACSMVGSETSTGVARDTYQLIPLIHRTYGSYWLGVTLAFQFIEGYYKLTSASLIIFKGLANDPEKTPILRAEWDVEMSEHAQPHWHVYRSFINEEIEFEESFGIEGRKDAKFHFAMSAKWYENVDAHQEKLDNPDKLFKWLEGCIKYTRRQIEQFPI